MIIIYLGLWKKCSLEVSEVSMERVVRVVKFNNELIVFSFALCVIDVIGY